MSYGTKAEVITVPPALAQHLVIEGLNGKTPLVATEIPSYEPDFPNSSDGAQPEYPTASLPESAAPFAFEPTWSGRVRHMPSTEHGWKAGEDAFGEPILFKPKPREITQHSGVLLENTVTGTLPTAEPALEKAIGRHAVVAPAAAPARTRSSLKWYNPLDAARYAYAKFNGETWTARTRITVGLGGLAVAAVGAASIAYGMKHGTTPPVFIDGKHPPTPTTDGHPTPIPTEYVPTPPSEASQPSGIDTPPVPEPQTEHFRAALSNDPETHRASNVYDWSTDALRDAGHEAGLTNTEIANITHNRHNIAQVNGSFYDQNHAVRDDPHHYLSADPRHNKYDVTEQQSTAHDIANAWKAEHHPEAASTAAQPNTDGTQTYGSGMPSADVTSETKVDVDKELQRLLDEINAENQPAVAAPVVPKEVLLGLTERELRNVQAAIGVIATTTLIPLTFRAYGRQRDRRLANERQNEWGDNGKGQPVQNHRAFYNRAPTVPNRAKPAAWFASHKVKPVETVTA